MPPELCDGEDNDCDDLIDDLDDSILEDSLSSFYLDEDGDGQPDMGEQEANLNTWHYFEMPDYLWYQEDLSLDYDFEPLVGKYAILGTTSTSREDLFGYFGKLKDLLDE